MDLIRAKDEDCCETIYEYSPGSGSDVFSYTFLQSGGILTSDVGLVLGLEWKEDGQGILSVEV